METFLIVVLSIFGTIGICAVVVALVILYGISKNGLF